MPRKRVALSIVLARADRALRRRADRDVRLPRSHAPPSSRRSCRSRVTIVAVRFFGLSRPLARYLDRLASHDLALRSLGRIRARFYARIEPLAPAQLEGFRRGDLVSRMVGDVDALQGLYLRGIGPPAAAIVAAIVVRHGCGADPPGCRRSSSRVGLLLGGVGVPLLSAALSPLDGRRARRVARGAMTADLVELLRGAPELVLYGREEERLEAVREADRELARHARRDALVAGLGTGLLVLVAGLTTVGVLAAAVVGAFGGSARPRARRDGGAPRARLVRGRGAASGCGPGARARRSRPGRRVLELIDRPSLS